MPANQYSDSLLTDALLGSLSNLESVGRGYAVAPLGLLGDINALGREYITPRLPQSVQGLLQSMPAAPTTEKILSNIPRVSAPRRESAGMEQLGAAMNPRGPLDVAMGAERAAMAAGRAGERYAERVVPQIMERGGMPAQLLSDLSQGSRRQIFVPASSDEAMKASRMLKTMSPQDVWNETGVGKYGGEYVKEISDDIAKIKEERLPEQYITDVGYVPSWKLGDVLDHPELMKAYPDLAGIESSFRSGAGAQSAKASYNPAMDWISYNKEMYQKAFVNKDQQEKLLKAKEKYDNFLGTKEYQDYDKLLNDKLDETGDFASLDPLINKDIENKRQKLWDDWYGALHKIQKKADQGYTLGSGQSAKSTTMHEVQHAIQQRAGWQGGGNAEDIAKGLFFERDKIYAKIGDLNQQMREAVGTPKYDDLMEQRMSLVNELQSKGLMDTMDILQKAQNKYEALGGEAQARLTQTRLNLTPEQRRQYFPFAYGKENYGLDVKPEDLIFNQGGLLGR